MQKFILILHLVKSQDAATNSSEPDLIQDVSYVEPDSNKFLKTNSEVSLIIVHWIYFCCVITFQEFCSNLSCE